MGVHVSSVVSTRIQNFDSVLYTVITNKEEYQYDSGTNGRITEYQPLFQNLSDAIESFFDTDREEITRDFIQSLYSYKVMADLFGTESSLLSSSDSETVQSMDGFRSRIKTDSLSYYDDYPQVQFTSDGLQGTITRTAGSWVTDGFTDGMSVTVTGTTSNDGTYTIDTGGVSASALTLIEDASAEGPIGFVTVTGSGSVRMGSSNLTSDINLVNGAYSGQELPDMNTLISGYRSTVAAETFNQLFSTPTPLTVLSKDDLNTYIFDTLGYRDPYSELNIGGLTIPPAP